MKQFTKYLFSTVQPDYSDVSCLKHRLEQSNAPIEKKQGCSMHSAEGFFFIKIKIITLLVY